MRRISLISGVTGAIFASLTPIAALLVLQPGDYGLFSIIYLIAAFGISLQYSVVSEAWARKSRAVAASDTWREYSGSLTVLSLLVALAAAIVAIAVPDLMSLAAILGAAVLCMVFRNGSRYHAMANGSIQAAVRSDVIGTLAFFGGLFASLSLGDIDQIAIAWLAGGIAATIALRLPSLRWGSGLISWCRSNGKQIKPLLADSLIMDAGAIGTPFLLAGFMGPKDFGIYRAVSNAALPVRLLVDPMRPVIGRMSAVQIVDRRPLILLGCTTLVLSSACFAILEWGLPALTFDLGTLSSLTPHAAATAVFVAGSFLGTVFYISCRTNCLPREIIFGRVAQTILVISMPILGYAWFALSGAIWGFSLSSALSAVIWALLVVRSRSREAFTSTSN